MSLFRSETYAKGIIYSTGFNLMAKLIAFANNIIVAFYFGTKTDTDIFFYALAAVSLLISFVTSVNQSVLIPESIRIRQQENEQKTRDFLNFFFYLYLITGIFTISLLYLNPTGIFAALSKFDKSSLVSNTGLLYMVIPLFMLMLLSVYLTDILASYRYFIMPMIASSVNSILSLLFVTLFHNTLETKSIVSGLTAGYILNIILLIMLMKKRLDWSFRFRKIKVPRFIINNILFSQAGNMFSILGSYIPLYLLSGFGGGVVTALNYGKNISEIPNQIITNQFSVVSGIRFNELASGQQRERLNKVFLNSTKFLIFFMAPVSALFFLFPDDIIRLLYLRGEFNEKSVADTAMFLKYFGLLLPMYAINTMTSRIFMATQKIKISFIYQIIANIVLIAAVILMINKFGAVGYPWASAAVYLVSAVAVRHLMKLAAADIMYLKIIRYLFLVIFINIIISLAVFVFVSSVDMNYIIEMFAGGIIYYLLLITVNEIFSVNKDSRIRNLWNLRSIL